MTTAETFRTAESEETLRVIGHIRDLNRVVAETMLEETVDVARQGSGALIVQRLEALPFLLADFRFTDEAFWLACTQREEPRDQPIPDPKVELARHLLSVAWHCGRAGAGSRLLLGIAREVGELITTLRFRQINAIATFRAAQVSLRWADVPEFWQTLITTARDGDEEEWSRFQVHALRLLGRECL